jgi:chromosome segregation ATPase
MLKFDAVVAKNREAQGSNEVLQQQLQVEQQHTQQLSAHIDTLRQNEEQLKAREVELNRQLIEFSQDARDHSTSSLAIEQESAKLREELRRTKDGRSAANAEVARLQRDIQMRDKKLDDYDVSAIYLFIASFVTIDRHPLLF